MNKTKTKRGVVVSALMLALMGVVNVVRAVPAAFAWGPERTTYTNENPAPKAVFNSITNNAAVGDERDFVRIVEVHEDGTKDTYANEVSVSGGKTYEVYIYYHNDASSTYNDRDHDYVGVARESRISASFPESIKEGEKGEVNAVISSSTTAVPEVWDEAYMLATEDVSLAYINGTAKIFNDWEANGSVLSTNLFTSNGTYIGLNQLNGIILGCDEFSGQVVFQVKATSTGTPEDTPSAGFELDKKVSNNGGVSWVDSVDVKPGDELEFKVSYRNTGSVAQKDVSAFDTLEEATGMEYIPGSTRIVRNGVEQKVDDATETGIFSGGLRIGDVAAGEEVEIYYKAKISENTETFSCGKTVLHNLVGMSGRRADQEDAGLATVYDKVSVNVIRDGDGCLPSRLPETGPAQVILAGVVGGGVLVGFGYWLNSKRQLKKMKKEAKGEMKEKKGEGEKSKIAEKKEKTGEEHKA